MKASYVVWLGVNLREELLRIWTFCFTRFCSVLRRKISFTDCVDEDSWDEDNSHSFAHAISCFRALHHRWHFASSSSFNLDSFLKNFFKRDQNQKTDDLWYTRKLKKICNTNRRRPALLRIFSASVKNLLRIVGYMWKRWIGILEYSKKKRNLRSFDIKTSLHRAAIFFSLLMDSIT